MVEEGGQAGLGAAGTRIASEGRPDGCVLAY